MNGGKIHFLNKINWNITSLIFAQTHRAIHTQIQNSAYCQGCDSLQQTRQGSLVWDCAADSYSLLSPWRTGLAWCDTSQVSLPFSVSASPSHTSYSLDAQKTHFLLQGTVSVPTLQLKLPMLNVHGTTMWHLHSVGIHIPTDVCVV